MSVSAGISNLRLQHQDAEARNQPRGAQHPLPKLANADTGLRLILIRHGETACNVNEIWHGWDDCELTPTGLAQAESVAVRLAGEPIAAVYTSDSRRAVQTAEAIARGHSLVPIRDRAFRERSAGRFQGLTFRQVIRLRPTVWEERAVDYWGWRPPGGETFRQLLARTLAGIERLRIANPDQTVALVAHMGTVRVLMCHLLDIPIERSYDMELPSTGVSIFRFENHGVHAEVVNDAMHAPTS